MEQSINSKIQSGVTALERGNTLVAMMTFDEIIKVDSSPVVMAYHGHCIALERHEFRKGLTLCKQAVEKEPNNSTLWLIFGRTCLLANKKAAALKAFRRGLKAGRNPAIAAEIKRLGQRKAPVIESLGREHLVNRYLGIAFNKLGLR